MDDIVDKHKKECVRLCKKLIYEIKLNEQNAALFLGDELHAKYNDAADKAINKANEVLYKISNI